MLPKSFNTDGFLSQDYDVTFAEMRDSLLVQGPDPLPPSWDSVRRRWLVDNLEILVRQLWVIGIERIYVNGSFVTAKDKPGDIDACFECDYAELKSGRLAERLNAAAPEKVWAWRTEDRVIVPGYPKGRLPMWSTYRVEMYPMAQEWPIGVFVEDRIVPFPEGFRLVKNSNKRKGIVILKKGLGD